MLLFSTILDINEKMTKDDFIRLVIEWNQGSPFESNVIKGIEWKGERNIRYGTEDLWLDIQEYRNKNIIAVQYEKRESDGVIWDSDYVMNFDDMKMSVRLERSYLEEALAVDPKFSTPHIITLLIERGYLKQDHDLAVLRTPVMIDDDNLNILTDVINGQSKHRLPVVFVSKTAKDDDPVDVSRLAASLKGAAHVLVQESNCTNYKLRNACESKNEYYGAIGIYYPRLAIGHKKYFYRRGEGYDAILAEKVIRAVIQYGNTLMVDPLYTWQGVNNALLRDRYISQKEERTAADEERRLAMYKLFELKSEMQQKEDSMREQAVMEAKAEADKLLDSFDDDIKRMQAEIARLSKQIDRLEFENQGLRTRIASNINTPVLYMGDENDDFYPGEVKDLLLATLSDAVNNMKPKTRRYDVVKDIIKSNDYQHIGEQRAAKVKALLTNYSGMTPKVKSGLEEVGYQITYDGRHYKAFYYGYDRYMVVYGATPSDGRAGKNNMRETINTAF